MGLIDGAVARVKEDIMADARVADPATAFRFVVNSTKLRGPVGFSKISGIKEENEVMEYREGSDRQLAVRKIPGLRTYPEVTFEKGLTRQGLDLVNWRRDVLRGAQGFRAPVSVSVQDCTGVVARTAQMEQSWPSSLEMSDLDGSSSEVAVETMTIVHEGNVKGSIFLSGGAAAAAAGAASVAGAAAGV